jgi:hypothetical protein
VLRFDLLYEGFTTTTSGFRDFAPSASFTSTVNLKVPARRAVPASVPSLCASLMPTGSLPCTIRHVSGRTPLLVATLA